MRRAFSASDRKEFLSNDCYESSRTTWSAAQLLFGDILDKADFAKTFIELLPKLQLSGKEAVLEMGACHGWASALVKQAYPGCHVVASDLLTEALQHAEQWESFLGCRIDEKWACHCRDLPFADKQFDRVFTFASFHHFGVNNRFEESLREMLRLLRPGGKIVLLYEPSAPAFLYHRALNRVNRKRADEGVDEDLIIPERLQREASQLGAQVQIDYYPNPSHRESPGAAAYYFMLSKVRAFAPLSVCTINVTIFRD